MRVYPDHLGKQLSQSGKQADLNYFLIFGDEPLIRQESQQQVMAFCRQQGFEEHHSFVHEANFNWEQVFDCANAMSLFANRQIISIQIDKTDKAITDALLQLAQLNNPDTVVIVHGAKLTMQQMKAKWFVTMDKQGLYIPCQHPDAKFFPVWMSKRLQAAQLNCRQDVTQFMCRQFEGNLLAASQEIEKLSLQFKQQTLTLAQVEANITGHTHFGIFQWLDTLYAGKNNRAERMLQQLKNEGTELILLSGTLNSEVKKLLGYRYQYQAGEPLNVIFKKAKLWQSKQDLISQVLNRLSTAQLEQIYALCGQLDVAIKSQYGQDNWPLLQLICVLFQGQHSPIQPVFEPIRL